MPRMLGLRSRFRRPYRLQSVYERMLGTEVEFQIIADTRAQAEHAEQIALAELAELTRVLNRFDESSELRRWLGQTGERVALSPALREVLHLADQWRTVTGGAFHPGADALGALWKAASERGVLPTEVELAQVAAQLHAPPWTLHGDGTATLHATYPLGLNALAKGFIVDAMAEIAKAQPGVQIVLVNAGGDLRTIGGTGLKVAIANAFTPRDDAPPTAHVRVQNGALATSGSAHRGYRIGETWYSHVLDPRSGQPVQDVPGVTVIAPDCATADALATALSVLDLGAGLQLADQTPNAAALIVTRDGREHRSTRWPE